MKQNAERDRCIADMIRMKMAYRNIATIHGLTKARIVSIAKEQGVGTRTLKLLTTKELRLIGDMLDRGCTTRDIAELTGRGVRTVSRIKRRRITGYGRREPVARYTETEQNSQAGIPPAGQIGVRQG